MRKYLSLIFLCIFFSCNQEDIIDYQYEMKFNVGDIENARKIWESLSNKCIINICENFGFKDEEYDKFMSKTKLLVGKYPFLKKMVWYYITNSNNTSIRIEYDPKLKDNAMYDAGSNIIYFKDASQLTEENFLHEFFHVIQAKVCYDLRFLSDAEKNIEFEIEVFRDLVAAYENNGFSGIFSKVYNNGVDATYQNWIHILTIASQFVYKELDFNSEFNKYAKQWNPYSDRPYISTFSPVFIKLFWFERDRE